MREFRLSLRRRSKYAASAMNCLKTDDALIFNSAGGLQLFRHPQAQALVRHGPVRSHAYQYNTNPR
jgi:hypothetical protein